MEVSFKDTRNSNTWIELSLVYRLPYEVPRLQTMQSECNGHTSHFTAARNGQYLTHAHSHISWTVAFSTPEPLGLTTSYANSCAKGKSSGVEHGTVAAWNSFSSLISRMPLLIAVGHLNDSKVMVGTSLSPPPPDTKQCVTFKVSNI